MKQTTAKVIMYCFTLGVVALLFLVAPEQAVQVMNTAALVLGGAALRSKLNLG